jgi:hypothetical protein
VGENCNQEGCRLTGAGLRPSGGIGMIQRLAEDTGLNRRAILETEVSDGVHDRRGEIQVVKANLAFFWRDVERRRIPLVRRLCFDFDNFVDFPGWARAAFLSRTIAPFSFLRCSALRAFMPGSTSSRAGALTALSAFTPLLLLRGTCIFLVLTTRLRPSRGLLRPFAPRAFGDVSSLLRSCLRRCCLCWTREYQFRYELADVLEDCH